jgi:hypothetical protein
MVEGPAPGRESVIAIDEQDRENVVADGLKTSHADKGNRRGNKSVFLGAFSNEINSLGRRFVSHQPPHATPTKVTSTAPHRTLRGRCRLGSLRSYGVVCRRWVRIETCTNPWGSMDSVALALTPAM